MSVTEARERVRLVDVRDHALSVDEVLEAVRDAACGGIVTFVGVVRDHDNGHVVERLDYSAHPTARERLLAVATGVAQAHEGVRVATVHRSGSLVVGDLAVVCAVSAPHRDAAFAACRDLIDTLKREVPIWKHQTFTDGASEWVGIA